MDPVNYARDYYTRYPRIAIGHWPPLYYIFQAGAYLLVGVNRLAVLLVMAMVVAGVLSFSAFWYSALGFSRSVAWAAALSLTCSSAFAVASGSLMADLLVLLLGLISLYSLWRYLSDRKLLYLLGYVVSAVCAIYSKADALSLVVPSLVGLMFHVVSARKMDWRLVSAGLLVGLATGPYYLLVVLEHNFDALEGVDHRGGLREYVGFVIDGITLGSWWTGWLIVVSLVLFVTQFERAKLGGQRFLACLLMSSWVVGSIAIHTIFPVSLDPRYLVVFLPLVGLGLAGAMEFTISRLPIHSAQWALPLAVLLYCGLSDNSPLVSRASVIGYRECMSSFAPEVDGSSLLICCDSQGDGALVAENRLSNGNQPWVMVRADQALAEANWMGKQYRQLVATKAELDELLVKFNVKFVLLDTWGEEYPHGAFLEECLTAHPEEFPLQFTHKIERQSIGASQTKNGVLRIFRIEANRSRAVASYEMPLPKSAGGGTVTIHLP